MVKIKYSALYTDDLGCEQAELYLLKDRLELKVRNCIFRNEEFDFDFISSDMEDRTKDLFLLKRNELSEYFIDVKVPLMLTYKGVKCVKEFLLRIERNKEYYINSICISLNGDSYVVKGYNLQELLKKMKNKLPMEYDLEDDISCLHEAYYIKARQFKDILNIDNNEEHYELVNGKLYSYLSSVEEKSKFKRSEKIPINYISENSIKAKHI